MGVNPNGRREELAWLSVTAKGVRGALILEGCGGLIDRMSGEPTNWRSACRTSGSSPGSFVLDGIPDHGQASFLALEERLTAITGLRVALVTAASLKPYMGERVRSEAVAL